MSKAEAIQNRDHKIVRISTAGSVDDGKSTLIGRLLYDCNAIFDDQLEAIQKSSKATGETRVNLALLTDGLRAEREQKITIDVAYRYFSTPKRRFIIADTPGHAQYTRNMVTGSSTADVAILLVDAAQGMTDQSKRHAFISSLLRVQHVLVAVNKMDLVGYKEERFNEIVEQFKAFSEKLTFVNLTFIPISALEGDNVATTSDAMPWYQGTALLDYLDNVHVSGRRNRVDFRFPVQYVIRPNRTFRGFAGEVASGALRVGEEVMALPSGMRTKITAINTPNGDGKEVSAGDSAIFQLADEIDISRGDMLVRPRNTPTVSTRFEAMACWMNDQALTVGKRYKLIHACKEVTAYVEELVYRINVESLHREDVESLSLNEIGRIVVRTAKPLFIDLYEQNRVTGSFILVDADSNLVMAAGMITRTHETQEDATLPEVLAGAVASGRGLVVWLTGLSGAGKSTLAGLLKKALADLGVGCLQIDGDALRDGLSSDLGFSEVDRNENIRRASEMAKLLANQGYVVICSFISPLQSQRELARKTVGDAFMEVHVECTVDQAIERDPKGLYKRALAGEIKQFTGVSAPYERPAEPELRLDTGTQSETESVEHLMAAVLERLRRS